MDRAVLQQPSEFGEPNLPHGWHSANHPFITLAASRRFCRRLLANSSLALRYWLDVSVRRARIRRQASGVLPRLAIPVSWREMVAGEGERESLDRSLMRRSCPQSPSATNR